MQGYVPRLKEQYRKEVVPQLQKELGYKNVMEVPELQKIVINQGLGDAVANKRIIETAVQELSMITGQKAVPAYSRKDVSSFKLRKGMPIGVKVTLRKDRMYEFLDRFICVALPRTRDFNGVKVKGFDGQGNFNMGVREQIIFPEIDIDKVNRVNGMNVTFVTSAKSDKEAYTLLKSFEFPFDKAL